MDLTWKGCIVTREGLSAQWVNVLNAWRNRKKIDEVRKYKGNVEVKGDSDTHQQLKSLAININADSIMAKDCIQ